jgi:thiol-disulfide isomerase/thioredoxin
MGLHYCPVAAASATLTGIGEGRLLSKSHVRRQKVAAIGLLILTTLSGAIGVASDSRPVSSPFKDLSGKKVRVSDLRGKIVVLNFWATWCVPCRAEMPMLVEAETEYSARGVSFIAVSLDDRETRLKIPDFVREFNIAFPIWVGGSTMDLEDLKLGKALPATAFIDRDGKITARVLGQVGKDELYERLDWLTGDRTARAVPNPLVRHVSGN